MLQIIEQAVQGEEGEQRCAEAVLLQGLSHPNIVATCKVASRNRTVRILASGSLETGLFAQSCTAKSLHRAQHQMCTVGQPVSDGRSNLGVPSASCRIFVLSCPQSLISNSRYPHDRYLLSTLGQLLHMP